VGNRKAASGGTRSKKGKKWGEEGKTPWGEENIAGMLKWEIRDTRRNLEKQG